MPYLVDTNVLLRAYWEPDKNDKKYENKPHLYEADKKLCFEASRAIEELKNRKEKLYYTKDILDEAKKVASREVKDNGFGLSDAEKERLFAEIEKSGLFAKLPEEPAKLNEKLKEVKDALEAAKATANQDEKKELVKAERDASHAAAAKVHGLDVLTFNTKHFEAYKDIGIKAERPRDVVLELRPEQVRSYNGDHIKNPEGEYYKGTKTFEVELASGKIAKLNIKGLVEDKHLAKGEEYKKDDVRDIIYHPEVIKKLEDWNPNSKHPVRIEIKNPSIEITPSSGGSGSPPTNNSPSGKQGIKYVVEQKSNVLTASKDGLSKAVSEVSRNAVNKTVQAAADASKATAKTAAKIASVPIKAVEKVSEIASQVSTTVKMTKIVAHGIKEEIRSNFQVHKFEVQLGNKKYEASIKGKTREEAQEKLQIVLQDKKFVKELKAQKEPKILVTKAEKIVRKEASRDVETKERLARKREQEAPPPPPPKQEQSINR